MGVLCLNAFHVCPFMFVMLESASNFCSPAAALQNQMPPLRNVSSGRHAACTRHATQDMHPALDRHAQVVTDLPGNAI